MERLPQLNFPPFSFKISMRGGTQYVWDNVRRGWFVLTPEEWVRQHLVRFFVEHRGVASPLIVHEYPVAVQGMAQRADVVVCLSDSTPLILVECKAASVAINSVVYAQAVRYNAVVGAKFIMLTNGLNHYVYQSDGDGGYRCLDSLPELKCYF